MFGLFALPLIDLLHAFLSSECSEFSQCSHTRADCPLAEGRSFHDMIPKGSGSPFHPSHGEQDPWHLQVRRWSTVRPTRLLCTGRRLWRPKTWLLRYENACDKWAVANCVARSGEASVETRAFGAGEGQANVEIK